MNLIKLFICSIAIIILLKMLIKRLNNIMYIIKKEKNKLNNSNGVKTPTQTQYQQEKISPEQLRQEEEFRQEQMKEEQLRQERARQYAEREKVFIQKFGTHSGLDEGYISKMKRRLKNKPINYEYHREGLDIAYINKINRRLPMDSGSYINDGYMFEEDIAYLLKCLGYTNVEVTPPTGDFGVDILAEKNGISYAIQCKKYSGRVGVDAVQQVLAGKGYYKSDIGVVVTNSYFTQQAIELAKAVNIELWDNDKLNELSRQQN